jgi:hypothetical protein
MRDVIPKMVQQENPAPHLVQEHVFEEHASQRPAQSAEEARQIGEIVVRGEIGGAELQRLQRARVVDCLWCEAFGDFVEVVVLRFEAQKAQLFEVRRGLEHVNPRILGAFQMLGQSYVRGGGKTDGNPPPLLTTGERRSVRNLLSPRRE